MAKRKKKSEMTDEEYAIYQEELKKRKAAAKAKYFQRMKEAYQQLKEQKK